MRAPVAGAPATLSRAIGTNTRRPEADTEDGRAERAERGVEQGAGEGSADGGAEIEHGRFCAEHHIGAEIEVIAADQVNEAYERVLASDVRYRFVIDTSTLADAPWSSPPAQQSPAGCSHLHPWPRVAPAVSTGRGKMAA